MKTFDVRIASARAPEIHFRVAADSWVSAWHEALSALGDQAIPEDASCTVGPARVEVECPSAERRFLIEPLAKVDPRVRSGQPMLVADNGELVPVHLEGASPREHASRFSTVRGAPLSPSRRKLGPPTARRPEPTPPTTPELARDADLSLPPRKQSQPQAPNWREDNADPLARVLSGLERQRLLARPLRINPKTGLPTPLEVAAAPPQGARQDARRPGPVADRRVRLDLPDLSRRATRENTAPAVPRMRQAVDGVASLSGARLDGAHPNAPAADPDDAEATSLPQQYRPVLSELLPPSGPALLHWAADAAWQQIPCALSLCLSGVDPLTVVAARGLRERESQGGRLHRDGAPGQLCRVSHRIRYAEGLAIAIEHPDGGRIELRVDSALCMPIDDGPEPLSLLLLNAPRPTGFTDGEARALAYLARTVKAHL